MKKSKDSLAKQWGFSTFEELLNSVDIKEEEVGEILSTKGLQHLVFNYKDNYVLKIPYNNQSNRACLNYPLTENLEICKKYFNGYIASETKVLQSSINKNIFITVQKKIKDFKVYSKIESNINLNNQFIEIVRIRRKLFKETGLTLDLTGWEGTTSFIKSFFRKNENPIFGNIAIEDNNLKITDFRLAPTRLSQRKSFSDYIYIFYGKLENLWINFLTRKIK